MYRQAHTRGTHPVHVSMYLSPISSAEHRNVLIPRPRTACPAHKCMSKCQTRVERVDGIGRLLPATPFPVVHELVLVELVPLHHVPEGSFRKSTLHDARGNVNDNLVFTVLRVKMRGHMIIPVHGDDNTQESTDNRHVFRILSTLLSVPDDVPKAPRRGNLSPRRLCGSATEQPPPGPVRAAGSLPSGSDRSRGPPRGLGSTPLRAPSPASANAPDAGPLPRPSGEDGEPSGGSRSNGCSTDNSSSRRINAKSCVLSPRGV